MRERGGEPVDLASLVVVRVVVGGVGVASALRTLANGWVDTLYAGPPRHFTYPGLHWVRPPGGATTALVVVSGVAAALVVAGLWYRPAMATFAVAFTWIEAIDVTTYLNHYWFLTTFAATAVLLPLGRLWSVDAWWARRRGRPPDPVVPRAAVWFVRAQLAVVYSFAGLAKVHPDWLVHGLPLRLWLPARAGLPVVGAVLAQPATAVAASWAGAVFDLTVASFLSWRRTRLGAWLAAVAFHLATAALFPIGVFPFLMVGATLVFFAPDWPRRVLRRPAPAPVARRPGGLHPVAAGAMAVVVVLHVLVPLRHLVIPGDARWTGESYRFSWNVLATEKAGSVTFLVRDRSTGRTRSVDGPAGLTALQRRVMATDPELIRQAARMLADDEAAQGRRVEVRVDAWLSLNGRAARPLIDPSVDLTTQPARLGHHDWILDPGGVGTPAAS